MVSELSLDGGICIDWTITGAGSELEGRFLEGSHHGAAIHPSQTTTLASLVFAKLFCYAGKGLTLPEESNGLHGFTLLLT